MAETPDGPPHPNKKPNCKYGIEDWLDMFGEKLLAPIPAGERAAARQRIVERLRPELYRDGVWYADYVRLRFVARWAGLRMCAPIADRHSGAD